MIKSSFPRPLLPFLSLPIRLVGDLWVPWEFGIFSDLHIPPSPRALATFFLVCPLHGMRTRDQKETGRGAAESSPPRGVGGDLKHNWPSEQPTPQNKSIKPQAGAQDCQDPPQNLLYSGLASDLGIPGNDVHPSCTPSASRVLTETLLSPLTVLLNRKQDHNQPPTSPLEAKSEWISNLCPLRARRWNLESLPGEKLFYMVKNGWCASEVSRKQR